MYTASNWLQPQIYADPNSSAIVTPPNGFGIQLVPKAQQKLRGGLGIFDSFDFSTWGLAEWVIIGVGVYFILNVGKGGSSSGRKRKSTGRKKAAGSKYGPYYNKLSPSDQAKARAAMGD